MNAIKNTSHDTHPVPDVTVREWRENGKPVRWDLYVTGFRKGTYKTEAGATRAVLRELMAAGTEHSFRATFGGRSEGARGVVERVGFPSDSNKVVIRDIAGNAHHWDARSITLA